MKQVLESVEVVSQTPAVWFDKPNIRYMPTSHNSNTLGKVSIFPREFYLLLCHFYSLSLPVCRSSSQWRLHMFIIIMHAAFTLHCFPVYACLLCMCLEDAAEAFDLCSKDTHTILDIDCISPLSLCEDYTRFIDCRICIVVVTLQIPH